ncbi:hypothetical protein ACVINW_004873 [Bradyrhizobium sp. USDA 4461]
MAAFLDACRFSPSTGGTADWLVAGPVGGYVTPTVAGAVNGRAYKYRAESADLSQWELGEGTWNASTGVLSRTTVLLNSSGTTSKVNFTVSPQVAVVALKEDLISLDEANAFSAVQQAQARANIAAIGRLNLVMITSSGTYTPSANLLGALVECVGGGGGGAGASGAGASGYLLIAAGGGAGGRSIKFLTAAQIGTSQTVTVGAGGAASAAAASGNAGGATSFGSFCVAAGGSGSSVISTAAMTSPGLGGAAGSGVGDFKFSGSSGGGGHYQSMGAVTSIVMTKGKGADSPYGQGGAEVIGNGSGYAANGLSASGYGAGGSGALSNQQASTNVGGGAGSPGLILVTEFLAA